MDNKIDLSSDNVENPRNEVPIHREGFGVSWHKAGGVSFAAMPADKLMEICIGEKRIGLVKKKDTIHAFAALCPHAGAPLCSGWLDGLGRIVCPDHKYRFDPANGRNTSGEGYKLFTYPTEIRGDEIYIGLRIVP